MLSIFSKCAIIIFVLIVLVCFLIYKCAIDTNFREEIEKIDKILIGRNKKKK